MEILFERGTLILRDNPKPTWLSELPGILWDPRVREWRAPAFRWVDLEAALHERGVRPTVRCRTGLSGRPDDPRTPTGASTSLRPYQEAALVAWELAERRGVVVLPTGAGKTRVGIAALQRSGGRALVLVPTRVLLDQWLTRLVQAGIREPGCYGDGRRELRPVTVATYASAWRHMERIGDRFDLLIVDEAHHFGSGLHDEALEMAMAPARSDLRRPQVSEPAWKGCDASSAQWSMSWASQTWPAATSRPSTC